MDRRPDRQRPRKTWPIASSTEAPHPKLEFRADALCSAADLLPPVTPSKIICVGRNYREHVQELGNEIPAEPLLFFKPPSSLLAPRWRGGTPRSLGASGFRRRAGAGDRPAHRNLKPDDNWREVLRGFTLANDISARDLQKKDVQWARAKGFDTFCPVGPMVSDELDLDAGVTIETRVNGELRQHASTRDFIFSVPVLLSYISAAFTLEPGDLILTGTPSGVGPLKPGDRVEVSIAGLGVLANTVEAEPLSYCRSATGLHAAHPNRRGTLVP